ncbi:cupin domain-containing protein [Streptomyces sp. NPDC002144]
MLKRNESDVPAETEDGTDTRWLLHNEANPHTNGIVGITRYPAGFDTGFYFFLNAEHAVYVLEGSGTATTHAGRQHIARGSLVFAPPGGTVRVQTGDDGLAVLRVFGGIGLLADIRRETADAPASDETGVVIVGSDKVEFVTVNDPENGFFNMRATFHVNNEKTGSRHMAFGESIFSDARSARPLHIHPNASEFLYVLDGKGYHVTVDGEVPISAGDACITPAREIHGYRPDGDNRTHFIFGFLGASSFEEAGTILVSR